MGFRTKDLQTAAAGAFPASHGTTHQDTGSDELSIQGLAGIAASPQKVRVAKASAPAGVRSEINFINGSNVSITTADNPGQNRVDVTIASTGSSGPASQIATSGTPVTINSTPPSAGMVLQATSATAAQWAQLDSAYIRKQIIDATQCTISAANILASNTAYWYYFGFTLQSFVPAKVMVFCDTLNSGVTAAEIALATTPLEPTGSGQTLTVIQVNPLGTLADDTLVGPTTPFTAVPAGVHLWGGCRTVPGGTAPVFGKSTCSLGIGEIMTTASAGVLTTKTYVGSIVVGGTSGAGNNLHPVIFISIV
jgi:hypothetical protein